MTDTAAAFFQQPAYDGRIPALGSYIGSLVRNLTIALAAIAVVGGAGAAVTVTAGWMVHTALSTNSRLSDRNSAGPNAIALTAPSLRAEGPAAPAALTLAARLDRARALAREVEALAVRSGQSNARVASSPPPVAKPSLMLAKPDVVPGPAVMRLAEVTLPAIERTADVPLPERRPVRDIARSAAPAPQQLAALPPPVPEKRMAPAPAEPRVGGRTAVYDISAHTVYLPDGRRLEAHSGIGERMDDPRFVHVRMRGPTPPNVYQLTLREQLFHGVRAIRLNPVDESKMFGRDGILAHTYMLGPSGQSNGCVSFKHYDAFLRAFLNGEIDRMVVVRRLDDVPSLAASLRRTHEHRYALNE